MKLLAALVLLAGSLASQHQQILDFLALQPPVVLQLERQGVIYSLHNDGSSSAVTFEVSSGLLYTSLADAGSATQARLGDPPLPTVTTTWTDANGVTHSVSTPFPGNTPAALRRTLDLHNQLVLLQQTLHPPAPPKPAPAPAVMPPGP